MVDADIEQEVGQLTTRIRLLDGEVRVVMEATGAYHLPLLTSLKQAGIFVIVINPLTMKKYASAALRKGKTDQVGFRAHCQLWYRQLVSID